MTLSAVVLSSAEQFDSCAAKKYSHDKPHPVLRQAKDWSRLEIVRAAHLARGQVPERDSPLIPGTDERVRPRIEEDAPDQLSASVHHERVPAEPAGELQRPVRGPEGRVVALLSATLQF